MSLLATLPSPSSRGACIGCRRQRYAVRLLYRRRVQEACSNAHSCSNFRDEKEQVLSSAVRMRSYMDWASFDSLNSGIKQELYWALAATYRDWHRHR